MNTVAVPVPTTGIVVVVKDEQWLTAIDLSLRVVDALAEKGSVQLVGKADLHIHGQLQLIVLRAAVPLVELLNVRQVCLPNQHPISRIAIDQRTQTSYNVMHLWQVIGVNVADVQVPVCVRAATQ